MICGFLEIEKTVEQVTGLPIPAHAEIVTATQAEVIRASTPVA